MPAKNRIFRKQQLGPKQLRTVADRRYDDAVALKKTNLNARANGAMYLGGFVIECLLKAKLLETYPGVLKTPLQSGQNEIHKKVYDLLYSHRLSDMLVHLPKFLNELQARGSMRLQNILKSICAEWTIYARYSPSNATMTDAAEFLEQVKELKTWLN